MNVARRAMRKRNNFLSSTPAGIRQLVSEGRFQAVRGAFRRAIVGAMYQTGEIDKAYAIAKKFFRTELKFDYPNG